MSRFGIRKIVRSIYQEAVYSKYKDQSFWILASFIPTFIGARLLVHEFPRLFLQVGEQHIHHFTYGILLLAISGFLAVTRTGRSPIWLAIMFGVGLALAVDETGMWLHLTNHYYNDTSEDAVVVVIALLINFVYFREFWTKIVLSIFRTVHRNSRS